MARRESCQSLIDFTDEVGVPEAMLTDGAGEFTGRHQEFVKHARRMRMQLETSEQGRHNQNQAAEREIGFLSKRWKRRMTKKLVPKRLWDFGLVHEAELSSRVTRGRDERTGHEEITGQTPEIGKHLDFEFHDLVWWWDQPNKPNATDDPRRLAQLSTTLTLILAYSTMFCYLKPLQ